LDEVGRDDGIAAGFGPERQAPNVRAAAERAEFDPAVGAVEVVRVRDFAQHDRQQDVVERRANRECQD